MFNRKNLKSQLWIYHAVPLLIWLGFVLLPFLFSPGTLVPSDNQGFMMKMFLGNILLLIIFYLHSYALYPLLEIRGRKFWYFLGLIFCLLVYVFISEQLRTDPPGSNVPMGPARTQGRGGFRGGPGYYFHLVRFFIVIICSYSYCLFLDNIKRERIIKEKENTQLKTELNFLRSQISPHFMFNVLNSMVSLARKKSDMLEPALVNMSSLMRYMLYENNGNSVNLGTEIEYLKNYIDLQLLRYGDSLKLNLYINGRFDEYRIEPMLLIPFVENAFKHGISMIEEPIIDISIHMDEGSSNLKFIVMNTISALGSPDENGTGIGLSNVKRRLILLYPDTHKLQIEKTEGVFKVIVNIKLA